MSMRASRHQVVQQQRFTSLGELASFQANTLRPPERLLPSEAAEKYRLLSIPGAYHGPYKNATTPYMVEPLDKLVDRAVRGVVFVGPAQCGKTDSLILNSLAYTIKCSPIDTIVYQTSQTVAADFSRTRLDRMHRHSPEIGNCLLPGGSDDTVHSKYYQSGIVVNLSWPTINELSGKPRGLVILTDYDRMPQDVDGEGSPFDLGMKRTTTFRSSGKTICESSPGFEMPAGATWIPKSKHEAPPAQGIAGLYNRGDRRRWHWKCVHCGEWFEPTFELLRYPTDCNAVESGDRAWMVCPANACVLEPSAKYEMNLGGRWVPDGQTIDRDGNLLGEPMRSDIASYWLHGVAAAFASWASLVTKYRQAEDEYQRTGSQEPLKTTVNTDQGWVYRRRGQNSERQPEALKSRADTWQRGCAPDDTRFLLTHVDVQGKKFVVQVHGILPGQAPGTYDVAVVDRFDITKSQRLDADGHPHLVEPASYIEDWALLDDLQDAEYEVAGKLMRVKQVFCDSGGREGVTAMAYRHWLDLRRAGDGRHTRFQLVKGDSTPGAPRAKISYPDASQRGKGSVLRGEVPVLMFNPNTLKDALDGMLNRATAGGGFVHMPDFLPDEFFMELCAEVREVNGWKNPKRHRNEAWDLLYYCVGSCVYLQVEHIDWQRPPKWAAPAADNPLARDKPTAEAPVVQPVRFSRPTSGAKLSDLGRMLA